jgi:hypothetical protein
MASLIPGYKYDIFISYRQGEKREQERVRGRRGRIKINVNREKYIITIMESDSNVVNLIYD